MDVADLFLVDEDQLHPLTPSSPLSDEVLSALQNDLGTAVGETVLPIAHWDNDGHGPLSLALNYQGELVALVLAEMFPDQNSIMSTLSTLEQWLAPMGLIELGQLSGNQTKFAKGLSELSPHIEIELASMLRILLINPPFRPNIEAMQAALPFSRIETIEVEAFEAYDGTVTISKKHLRSELVIEGRETTGESPAVLIDSPAMDALNETVDEEPSHPPVEANTSEDTSNDADSIDLTVEAPTGSWPTIIRGSLYKTADLPLYFDPTGSKVESLSSELFAVDAHIALVVNLDHYSVSPLVSAERFRWGASIDKNEMFSRHALDAWGRTRTLHLFVETEADAGHVFYVGRGELRPEEDPSDPWSLWFTISPRIDKQRLETLQSGQLPKDQPTFSFSFAAQRAQDEDDRPFSFNSAVLNEPLPTQDAPGTWVPNG